MYNQTCTHISQVLLYLLKLSLMIFFVKVKNHGIPEEVIKKMLCLSWEFFHLPESERMKNYSDDPMKTMRLSTSFNIKTEKVSNWRDFLRLHCHPLEDYINEWPTNPPSFRYHRNTYNQIQFIYIYSNILSFVAQRRCL